MLRSERHAHRYSQLDMADELERDRPFSRVSAENDCDDAIFLTSSDSAASALLGYAQEEQEMFEGEEVPCLGSGGYRIAGSRRLPLFP